MHRRDLWLREVSTTEQDEALVRDALAAAEVDRMFVDKVSGSLQHRPALDELLGQLRAGTRGGVAAGPARPLAAASGRAGQQAGAASRGLRSLTEQIDTTTPNGKLIFHLVAALAEFKRDLIRERTRAGLAAARARGRAGGRPSVWTPEKLRTARSMHTDGERVGSIARVLGVSRASVYRGLADHAGTPDGQL